MALVEEDLGFLDVRIWTLSCNISRCDFLDIEVSRKYECMVGGG